MRMMTNKYPGESIRVATPDGHLTVFILENEDGIPFEIQIIIGKSGSALAAWANSTAALCSMLLQTSTVKINDLIPILLGQNGDKVSITTEGIKVKSGPDGLAVALLKYQNGKFDKMREALGIPDTIEFDNEDEGEN